MRFPISTLLAIVAAPFLVAAATNKPNAFRVPEGGYQATAGQTLDLAWTPDTSIGGTVSLILRSGSSNALAAGAYIAQNIQNSGMYSWNIPSSVTRGSDYVVQIVSDSDNSVVNFTPYFVIESKNTVASETGTVTLGAPTESLRGTVTGTVSADSTITASSTADAESNSRSTTTTRSRSRSESTSASTSESSESASMTTTRSESPSSTDADATATSTAALSTGAASANHVPAVAAGFLALGALVF